MEPEVEAAAQQIKAEEGKAQAEQAGPPAEIPKKYRPYAIFAMTLMLLGGIAFAVRIIVSAIRSWMAPQGS